MGDEDVTIRLSGDAQALLSAIQQATDRFDMLRQTLSTTADAAKLFGTTFAQQAQMWLDAGDGVQLYQAKLDYLNSQMALSREQQDLSTQAIRDYTAQLSLTRETMTTLNDAQKVMGDGFAMQSQQWLQAATSADDYAARLAYVREQIAMTEDQMAMNSSASSSGLMGGLMSTLGGGGGFFGGLVNTFNSFGLLGDMAGPFGLLAGVVDNAANSVGGFIEQSTAFVTSIAAWTIIQDAIQWVDQLATELFNLQVQTQKADTGWQYLFGGPNNGGKAAATDMMQWSSKFSMNIPFTRQDLMGAITTLSTVGLSPAQIEQFMPTLSDIAATYGSASYGGQGVNLQQAANAIRMLAEGGQSRLLKYDLNINPQELIPYGLQAKATSTGVHITDMNSVFTSLEKFAQAKGVAGASGGIVGSTWWGGYSSLLDNIQNFLLNLGGTNLDGSIRAGSFFANLQQDLDNLLKWFGDHQDQLQKFSDIASHLLGDVVSVGGGLLGQLAQWFDRLGGVGALEQGIENIDGVIRQWFGMDAPGTLPTDKKHPMGHRQTYADQINAQSGPPEWFLQLTDAAEKLAALSWTDITAFFSMMIKDGPQMAQTLDHIAGDFQQIANSFTPDERQTLNELAKLLGGQLGVGLAETLWLVDVNLRGMSLAIQAISPLFSLLGQWLHQAEQDAHNLAVAFQDIANALQHMPNNLPSWMTGGFLGSGFGQSLASHMPGGFKSFGVLGAGWGR